MNRIPATHPGITGKKKNLNLLGFGRTLGKKLQRMQPGVKFDAVPSGKPMEREGKSDKGRSVVNSLKI